MDRSVLSRLTTRRTIVSAAVNGAVALLPLHRLRPWQRWLVAAAPGAAVGGLVVTAVVTSRGNASPPPWQETQLTPRTMIVVGLGYAAASTALGLGALRVDRWLEGALRRRGVERPRVVIAALCVMADLTMACVVPEDDVTARDGAASADPPPPLPPSRR